MIIEKAIEILGTYRDEGEVDLSQDLDNALTLGIEALKRLQWFRAQLRTMSTTHLPGETPIS